MTTDWTLASQNTRLANPKWKVSCLMRGSQNILTQETDEEMRAAMVCDIHADTIATYEAMTVDIVVDGVGISFDEFVMTNEERYDATS